MNHMVEHNGHSYHWSGDTWIDNATYMPPPGIVQQELNHRFGHIVERPATTGKKRPGSTSSESKAIQKTIGPIIVDFVRRRYAETQSFVHRDEITAHLLAHPEACTFLQQAYAQTEQKRSFEWYVGNQVDWLGADYEDPSRSEFDHLLEKGEMVDGKKGYRPR